jgi:hypothetical protein
MNLVDNELSEPYSIFTYRYFLRTWPHLCFMAFDGEHCFATVVAKMDVHRERSVRGYIGMLVVEKAYRYLGVGACVCPPTPTPLSRCCVGRGFPAWVAHWSALDRRPSAL